MSVLIKGLKMPKDCIKCPLCLFADGHWKCLADGSHADFGGTCRPQNCPLIELSYHGDLIDRDVLLSKVQKWYWEALETVKRMPTVIPAERGEE